MQRVGFIGLGAMGTPMAWNLHKAGCLAGVYNRTTAAAQPFREVGIAHHATPAALAAQADVVIIMVADPAALHEVMSSRDGVAAGLRPGGYVINMSTVSPEATRQAAAAVTARGGRFVDAPVSGTVKPAQDGTLVILAGGERTDIEDVTPILKTLGKEVIYCGPTGQGTHMKLVLNLLLGGMMALLAEAITLGRQLGLETEDILKAIASGPLNAPLYQLKGKMMLEGRYARQFPIDLMFKDLSLVLETAGHARVPLPATAAVREAFNAARGIGQGDSDIAAVILALEYITGEPERES